MLDTDGVSHWSSKISGLEGNLKLIESFHPFLFEFSVCSSSLKETLCCKLWKVSITSDWIKSCKYFWIFCQPVVLWLWISYLNLSMPYCLTTIKAKMFPNLLPWCILRDREIQYVYLCVHHFCPSGMIRKYGPFSLFKVVMSIKSMQMPN